MVPWGFSSPNSTNTHLPSTSPLMVFCQRGGGLECPHAFGTPAAMRSPAPPEGRSPRPQSAPERHRAWNVNRASFHDISKTIRTTGSHVRVPDTRTDRRKIGLGHRHRWLCRAGDRRLALRAVRREHHIRPPSVRRNQKRAQRGRASSIKAPAQGKRSDNAAAWPEVMTTQIIAIRGRLTRRRLAYSIQSAQSQLIDFRHF